MLVVIFGVQLHQELNCASVPCFSSSLSLFGVNLLTSLPPWTITGIATFHHAVKISPGNPMSPTPAFWLCKCKLQPAPPESPQHFCCQCQFHCYPHHCRPCCRPLPLSDWQHPQLPAAHLLYDKWKYSRLSNVPHATIGRATTKEMIHCRNTHLSLIPASSFTCPYGHAH